MLQKRPDAGSPVVHSPRARTFRLEMRHPFEDVTPVDLVQIGSTAN